MEDHTKFYLNPFGSTDCDWLIHHLVSTQTLCDSQEVSNRKHPARVENMVTVEYLHLNNIITCTLTLPFSFKNRMDPVTPSLQCSRSPNFSINFPILKVLHCSCQPELLSSWWYLVIVKIKINKYCERYPFLEKRKKEKGSSMVGNTYIFFNDNFQFL